MKLRSYLGPRSCWERLPLQYERWASRVKYVAPFDDWHNQLYCEHFSRPEIVVWQHGLHVRDLRLTLLLHRLPAGDVLDWPHCDDFLQEVLR